MFEEAQASKTHVTVSKRFCSKTRHDKILVADLSEKTTATAGPDFTSKSDPDSGFVNKAVNLSRSS